MDAAALIFIMWIAIGGWVGWMIGKSKGRAGDGMMLGALLGVIGWIVAALMSDHSGGLCSECKGRVPVDARRCMHCGFVFPQAPSVGHWAPEEPKEYFVALEGKPSGPFTRSDVKRMLKGGAVAWGTPLCRNGDAEWKTVGDCVEVLR